jgi:ribosomal protein S12 methylthiotransferase
MQSSTPETQNTPPKAPVYFVSLGCPKNLVDSQVMLGMLEKDRYSITQSPEDAEVIIVNTCSFIQASKEESIETILEMAQQKEAGQCKVLVASGCLSQRYSEQLEKEMPEVDLFIGFGGVVARDAVKQRAEQFVESFSEIATLAKKAAKKK